MALRDDQRKGLIYLRKKWEEAQTKTMSAHYEYAKHKNEFEACEKEERSALNKYLAQVDMAIAELK